MLHLNLNYPLPVFLCRLQLKTIPVPRTVVHEHYQTTYAVPVRLLLPFTRAATEDREHPFRERGRWLQKENISHHREPRGERLLIDGPEKHVVVVAVSVVGGHEERFWVAVLRCCCALEETGPSLFHHPHWINPQSSHHPGQSRRKHNGPPRLDIAYRFLPYLARVLVGAVVVPVRQLPREVTSRAYIHRYAHPRNLL